MLFKNSAEAKKISLNSIVHHKYNVLADKNMANTIMRNLISNSIKFTSEKGLIEIRVSEFEDDGRFLQISISDNGTGIKQENLEMLFKTEEYFTTKGTNQEKGTGLGLLLCKELVEKNGGQISCVSEFGKGSTFSFTLLKNDEMEQ
jgi:signal transduction histidine kinase